MVEYLLFCALWFWCLNIVAVTNVNHAKVGDSYIGRTVNETDVWYRSLESGFEASQNAKDNQVCLAVDTLGSTRSYTLDE